MPSVLFVCTANQYRSPIAAALFKARVFAEKRPGMWDINSAGTWTIPGLPPTPLARKLARSCGLILEMHRTRLLSQAQLINSDLILVMEAGHQEALLAEFPSIAHRVFLLSEVVDGVRYDIPDPASSPEHAKEYIQELCEIIERGFPRIADLAVSLSDDLPVNVEIVEGQDNIPQSGVAPKSVLTRESHPGPSNSQPVGITGTPDSSLAQRDHSYPSSTAWNPARVKRPGRPARRAHRFLFFLLPAILILLGWGGFRLWQVYQLSKKVLVDIRQLTALAQSPSEGTRLAQAGTALSVLNQDLIALKDQVGPFLWVGPLLRWVPVYGGDLASAKDLLDLGNDLVLLADQAYLTLLPIMQTAAPNATGSSLDPSHLIEMLNQARPGLASTRLIFDRAKLTRQRIHLQQLSPNLRRLIAEEVDPLMAWMDDGLSLAASLPSISGMGSTGPRTYLLLVENEDELRPSGGFITAVGTLVVQDGKIISLTFKDSGEMEDWSKPYPLAPWQLEQYMNSPVLIFRDSNWFVDFPTSAEYAKYLYRLGQKNPMTVDGVIAFNQNTLVSLLEVLGPIQVDDIPYPITATNVEDYMRNAKTPPPGELQTDWYRKAFISKLAQAVLNDLLSPGNSDWNKLSAVVLRLLDERQILLQINDSEASQVFARRGWDGAVRPGDADFLYIVDSNIGFNKTNALVSKQFSYDVDLSDPAHPTSELTVIESNHASANIPCIQWNEGQIAGEQWYPIDRCYWDYLRVYQSSQATLADSTPHAVPRDWMILEQGVPPRVDVLDDEISGVQGYGTLVVVPGGQSLATTFKFALPPTVLSSPGPDSNQRIYRLKIQKQAGTQAVPVTVRIHFPRRVSLLSVPAGALIQDANVMLQANLDTDLLVEVIVRLP